MLEPGAVRDRLLRDDVLNLTPPSSRTLHTMASLAWPSTQSHNTVQSPQHFLAVVSDTWTYTLSLKYTV